MIKSLLSNHTVHRSLSGAEVNRRAVFKTLLIFSFYLLTFCKPSFLSAQSEDSASNFKIMFYNTENLFHPDNDSLTNDDDYTPEGNYHWTFKRYQHKLYNIYKVITAVGNGNMPDIVGFCEIENRKCLQDLINRTPLVQYNYEIKHYQSADSRGIDVGLIYRKDKFSPISDRPIKISYPEDLSNRPTRDILYVKGLVNNTDTLHVFVNHWPSKYGGAKETDPLRMYVGELLKAFTDSIMQASPNSKIVLIGDFNDEPEDRSITEALGAQVPTNSIKPNQLYNLSYDLQYNQRLWTHKFQDHGGIIDQIIVSGAMLESKNGVYTTQKDVHIYQSDFLLMEDDKFLGKKPFRTYTGMTYTGGFSDHLPVWVELKVGK
ncbi:MAG: endonuclease/exonuclease/phosphatase family protein [Bacteroidota bacterium]